MEQLVESYRPQYPNAVQQVLGWFAHSGLPHSYDALWVYLESQGTRITVRGNGESLYPVLVDLGLKALEKRIATVDKCP